MKLAFFSGKKVALLGAGKDNLSLIPFLLKYNAQITLCEQNTVSDEINPLVKVFTGEGYLDGLNEADVIIRSPGIGNWQVKEMLIAKKNQIPIITTAIDIFLDNAPGLVIGVTGTKGKGTTSVMIGQILKEAGKDVYVLGNIGKTVFSQFNDLTDQSIVVAELSSFMLEDVTVGPTHSVVLAITPDHLQPLSANSPNYHRSFEEYVQAKKNIVSHLAVDGLTVYNLDNEPSRQIGFSSKSKTISVSLTQKTADYYLDLKSKQVFRSQEAIINLSNSNLKGDHIFLNALYAIALTSELKISRHDIELGLKNFTPLPHRLEIFAKYNEITFVDDSYATAPDATIAALSAFSSPIILIAGGLGKGADFKDLAKIIATSNVKALITLGQESDRIAHSVRDLTDKIVINQVESLEQAVVISKKLAQQGDAVLLSPGCASTDMFKNASQRGAKFKDLVKTEYENF